MKKFMVALMLCLVSIIGFGQYTSKIFEVKAVDEFGDETGTTNFGITLEGKFSNSATSGSYAVAVIKGNSTSDLMSLKLYEYGKYKSNDEFSLTLINDKDEELKSNYCWFVKEKSTLNEITYKKLIPFLKNSNIIKVKIVEKTKYGTPTIAVFKIDNPEEFAKLLEKYIVL